MSDTTSQSGLNKHPSARPLSGPKAGFRDPWLRSLFAVLKARTQTGQLSVFLPDGTCHQFEGKTISATTPKAVIRFHTLSALKHILKHGDIGLGETYMDGLWSSPDISQLIAFALVNIGTPPHSGAGRVFTRLLNGLHFFRHRNSRTGSRRNIAYHYDLGNDFYTLWLDDSMTYSSALFPSLDTPLLEAQQNKYRKIAEIAGIDGPSKVLEIGCGWGGFADYALQAHNVHIDGITLSREQRDYALARPSLAERPEQANILLKDYRDVTGSYDAIVSIEMFEAVGAENWDTWFQTVRHCLKPGGKAAVQVITIDERRYERYRKVPDFIQKYIFPGGHLPTKSAFIEKAGQYGLTARTAAEFGQDYAETLRQWNQRFQNSWETIRSLGFDDRFKRMWEFYLQYCEAGFRHRSIDVVIFELS